MDIQKDNGGLAMGKKGRIAILTGGGDCPGMNAVIRAVAKKAILEYGLEVIGIEDGYEGAIHSRHRRLQYDDVSGIITLGGTILGTSNIANRLRPKPGGNSSGHILPLLLLEFNPLIRQQVLPEENPG